MNIVEAIIEAVLWFIEWLIKAFILAFIYIMFAISLVIIAAGFLIIIGVVKILCEQFGLDSDISYNKVTIYKGNVSTDMGYNIDTEYNELIDLEIPIVFLYFKKGSTEFKIPFKFQKMLSALIPHLTVCKLILCLVGLMKIFFRMKHIGRSKET